MLAHMKWDAVMDGAASPNGTTVVEDNEHKSLFMLRGLKLFYVLFYISYYFILVLTSKLAGCEEEK